MILIHFIPDFDKQSTAQNRMLCLENIELLSKINVEQSFLQLEEEIDTFKIFIYIPTIPRKLNITY